MTVKKILLIILVIIILHYDFKISLFFLKTSKSEFSGNILECGFIYDSKDDNHNF